MKNYQVGQKVSYKVCNSIYEGIIVKINVSETNFVIIEEGCELYAAGYAVGDDVSVNQIININN